MTNDDTSELREICVLHEICGMETQKDLGLNPAPPLVSSVTPDPQLLQLSDGDVPPLSEGDQEGAVRTLN